MTPEDIARRLRLIINDAESALTMVEPASLSTDPDIKRATPYISRIWTQAETILNAQGT